MKLKTKILGLEAGGKPIVILNKLDADDLGIRSLDRVRLQSNGKELTAIVNITKSLQLKGMIGVYSEVITSLGLKEEMEIEVDAAKFPSSLQFIRNKLAGRKLTYEEFLEIVKDTVEGNLNEMEIASFVTALHTFGIDLEEAAGLALAMVETGERLKLNRICMDKHCLPYNIPTIVRNGDEIKTEYIGTLIDNIFDKCSPDEIESDGNYEYTGKNLRELNVLVHDENGKVSFVPATGVFRVNSPGSLEEIELIGNRKIQCTSEHTIFALKKGKILNIPAKEINVGDYVLVPSGLSNNKNIEDISFKWFRTKKRNYRKFPVNLKITPEFMRLLGYYISEGFTNYEGVFFNFGSHEKGLIDDCIKCVENVFGFTPTKNYPHSTATRVCLYSQVLAEMFNQVIKAGENSLNKQIPGFIFDASEEMKREFLKALMWGDGYQRRGYEEIYVTASKKLAIGLQYFLSLMGISATVSERKESERDFPLKNGTSYKSKTQKAYFIYTQAREIFGGRLKVNVAFINLLPINELGELDASGIGWKFRQELKRKKYITKQKLLRIIDKIKSEDVKKLLRGNLSVLKVKKHQLVKSNSKYVYDFRVDGYERFIAGNGPICIHNSIGGCVGDKTTLLVVPIIAAAGLTIPKTSSKAITSASGTADRAEVLMPVDLNLDEMKTVVNKTNGCIVWGGSLHLAPSDDIFIQVEYPLSIDPLLLPSIMSKKMAVGANYVVIDIPCGRGTKIKTIGDANLLAKDFIGLGQRLNIKTQCAITFGEHPLGYAIGPALEAREALEILMRRRTAPDIVDKATHIADMMMRMVGRDGQNTALEIIRSGRAEEKFREIIFEQGGDSEVKPEDIKVGEFGLDIKAERDGTVLWIDNSALIEAARAAGSPKDKGAGILLHKKVGDAVKRDENIFTIYTEKNRKLERVLKVLEEEKIFGIGDRMEILIQEVTEAPAYKKVFIIER